jgi:polysaccharide chain length determinant protein (PEP-CTERM system associated)
MINPGRSYNIADYKEILMRRRSFFIVPALVIFFAAILWVVVAPRKYEASTLVLVTPQRIPSDIVRTTVTAGFSERLNSISQEIMSRTRLEQVIDELKLYESEGKNMNRDAVIEVMRKNIKIELSRQSNPRDAFGSFVIGFTGDNPEIVTLVANKLASLYIEENLKLREQQAVGTTEFLASELASTKEKLEKQGLVLGEYKRRHMGSLPEQRDTNIRLLEQLQLLYQRSEESLRAAEDRKLLIRKQMADIESPPAVMMGQDGSAQPSRAQGSYEAQIEDLRRQLADLQSRYTEKHPDIVRTRKRIADKEKSRETTSVKNDPRYRELSNSIAMLDSEIKRLRDDGERLRGQIGLYRGRIEGATVREQEMATLLQDYNNTKLVYDTLIKKSEEAQQAENLERRQKGEQFRIVDPARVPEKPVKPDIPKTLLIGLFGGIACGLGGIFVREQLDRSFRDPEDVEATLGFKVLASIPKIVSKAS